MAVSTGQKILDADIINRFITDVTNVILANPLVHSGNVVTKYVPQNGNVPVVPVSLLGHTSEIPKPVIVGAGPGKRVNAKELYDAMVYVTHVLTRVGTYEFNVYYRTDGGSRKVSTTTGKALYTADYIRTLSPVGTNGLVKGNKITAQTIITLLQSCVSAWMNTKRYHSVSARTYCHSSCWGDCHSYIACHVDCFDESGGGLNCHTNHTGECVICYEGTLGTGPDGSSVPTDCHGNTPGCYQDGCNVNYTTGGTTGTGWGTPGGKEPPWNSELSQNTNMNSSNVSVDYNVGSAGEGGYHP